MANLVHTLLLVAVFVAASTSSDIASLPSACSLPFYYHHDNNNRNQA